MNRKNSYGTRKVYTVLPVGPNVLDHDIFIDEYEFYYIKLKDHAKWTVMFYSLYIEAKEVAKNYADNNSILDSSDHMFIIKILYV